MASSCKHVKLAYVTAQRDALGRPAVFGGKASREGSSWGRPLLLTRSSQVVLHTVESRFYTT